MSGFNARKDCELRVNIFEWLTCSEQRERTMRKAQFRQNMIRKMGTGFR
jgi:hypothetical protein